MKIKFLLLVSVIFLLTACGGKKHLIIKGHTDRNAKETELDNRGKIVDQQDTKDENPDFKSDIYLYVEKFHKIAENEMDVYGIPASITLAQGIFESAAGRSELARKSNNHFGIKCHGWKGKKVYHDDDKKQECFRKYKDPKYSFRDHSLFLKDRSRYKALFDLPIDDYKAWANGLKAAGYATNPIYAKQLIDIIERYDLHEYDEVVINRGRQRIDPKNKNINKKGIPKDVKDIDVEEVAQNPYGTTPRNQEEKSEDILTQVGPDEGIHVVQKGETLYGLSKQFDVSIEELKLMNHLDDNILSIGQELIVPKKINLD